MNTVPELRRALRKAASAFHSAKRKEYLLRINAENVTANALVKRAQAEADRDAARQERDEARRELARVEGYISEMHAVIERKNAIIHLMSLGDCEISSEEGLPVKNQEA